jgi:hypothetical protein
MLYVAVVLHTQYNRRMYRPPHFEYKGMLPHAAARGFVDQYCRHSGATLHAKENQGNPSEQQALSKSV